MKDENINNEQNLKVFSGIKRFDFKGASDNNNSREITKFKQLVFTDGVVEKVDESRIENINKARISNIRFKNIDTLEIKDVSLKDYNFIIVVTVSEEKRLCKPYSKYFLIRDVSYYLSDNKNKEALKNVKKICKEMNDYLEFFSIDEIVMDVLEVVDSINKVKDGIFTLKPKNQKVKSLLKK